ncbi:MAG: hypothetical protein PHI88_00565 [Candidatus Pacebacteria bacterium]|nr:hypothetical protein [Candidatus Paceibacterota bacterium]
MKIFEHYLKNPTSSFVLNTKLLLLTFGLDFDFSSIQEGFPEFSLKYKANKIKVSDRHFISVKTDKRNFIPDELILEDGNQKSIVKVYFRKESPFICLVKNKKFLILDKKTDKRMPVSVKAVPLYPYNKKKINGIPVDEFVSVVGVDRISIIPYDGCENWISGEQCKFCGANPKRLGFEGFKPNVFEIKNKFNGDYKNWWYYYRDKTLKRISQCVDLLLRDKIGPHFHFSIISGNISDLDFEWKMIFDIVDSIKDKIEFSKVDSYFNLMPPLNFEYIEKVFDYGFKYICFNLECFNKKIFKKVCPGKEKIYGYDRMLESLIYSADIFGKGRTRTNFVLGTEPLSGLIAGIETLAKKGVVSDYTVFFPRPGSVWGNRNPLPPQKILDFTEKLVSIYKNYKFKPFCCTLSSRSSIANEFYKFL